ncbi:hypothetical protein ACFL2K_04905, partial [Candidatus Margulisiibacteriota bacterium]
MAILKRSSQSFEKKTGKPQKQVEAQQKLRHVLRGAQVSPEQTIVIQRVKEIEEAPFEEPAPRQAREPEEEITEAIYESSKE